MGRFFIFSEAGGRAVRFFIKSDLKWELTRFKPEDHPYDYNPGFPLRHGLLRNGEIDWTFWCKQETWTFDQAVRLLDNERTGDDTFFGGVWPLYQEISAGLEKALKVSAGHHIFKGKPDTQYGFIIHYALVYPRPFLEWAYYNGFYIPAGLQSLLPKTLKNDQTLPFTYSNVAINKAAYIKALESRKSDDWDARRAITAQLLNDLGFTARETYMALSESGKSLDEPNGDPEAIARKWRRTGRHIMEEMENVD
jgi:hypothetical protein